MLAGERRCRKMCDRSTTANMKPRIGRKWAIIKPGVMLGIFKTLRSPSEASARHRVVCGLLLLRTVAPVLTVPVKI